jgi:hypothetical protein
LTPSISALTTDGSKYGLVGYNSRIAYFFV